MYFREDPPDFIADIIYLDGLDPDQGRGIMNGPGHRELRRHPMGADILRMEQGIVTLSTIITNGETVNAGFLVGNLHSEWLVSHDCFENRITF